MAASYVLLCLPPSRRTSRETPVSLAFGDFHAGIRLLQNFQQLLDEDVDGFCCVDSGGSTWVAGQYSENCGEEQDPNQSEQPARNAFLL